MTLKVGMMWDLIVSVPDHCFLFTMQVWVLKYYQVYSNDDPGLTVTYFTARSNFVPNALYGNKVKQLIFQKLF